MNEYFDKLSFDKKIKIAFEDFYGKKSLALYQPQDGVSLYLSSSNKPQYLTHTQPFMVELLTLSGIGDKNGAWNHLNIEKQYQLELTQALLKYLKPDEKEYSYTYISKFIEPSIVSEVLSQDLKELEKFLTKKKSKNSKYWATDNMFLYLSSIIVHKEDFQKTKILDAVLKNNNFYMNTVEQKTNLYKFVTLNIAPDDRQKFNSYYEEVGKFENKEVELLNYPSNILTIDIHKVTLSNYLSANKAKATDAYMNSFFNALDYVMGKKETIKILNVGSLDITQKTIAYNYYRISLTPKNDDELNKNLIEKYIKNFIQVYAGSSIPDKSQLSKINNSILLNIALDKNLSEKSHNTKRQKI